jgi:segregation and condensation protein B
VGGSPHGEPVGLSAVAQRIEALLFAAPEPVSVARLARVGGLTVAEALAGLEELRAHLEGHGHAIALVEVAGGYQLVTRPEYAEWAQAVAHRPQPPLSRAALETLAIVAWRQPITRAEIEELRGVQSEAALATLLERGLIAEQGRAEAPGRPYLYGTTRRFLEHFGLRSLEDLRGQGAVREPRQDGPVRVGPRPVPGLLPAWTDGLSRPEGR